MRPTTNPNSATAPTFLRGLGACLLALALWAAPASPARAEPRDVRIPLHDCKLLLPELGTGLVKAFRLFPSQIVPAPKGEIDLRQFGSSSLVSDMNAAFGPGFRAEVWPDNGNPVALLLHVDAEQRPEDFDAPAAVARAYACIVSPGAAAAQRKHWGLVPPARIDDAKPLVVLVHGLDTCRDCWTGLTGLLNQEGYPTAVFGYPDDGPIEDAARLLAQQVAELRRAHPTLKLHFITHSMGGLVTRAFLEGPSFPGNVGHLILLTPPNHGSTWTGLRLALEAQEHYQLWRREKDWNWGWTRADGNGEAGDQIKPGSKFLTDLNARPRREGVKYTIIAGSQNPAWRIGADCVQASSTWFPHKVENWWGVRHCRTGLQKAAESLRRHTSDNDGPVAVESTKLEDVSDFVVLPTDHVAVYSALNGHDPAAWATIRDRLRD